MGDEINFFKDDERFSNGKIITAIEQWLEYGKKSFVLNKEIGEQGHAGYFSGNGWAARCLRYHLNQIVDEHKKRQQ